MTEPCINRILRRAVQVLMVIAIAVKLAVLFGIKGKL